MANQPNVRGGPGVNDCLDLGNLRLGALNVRSLNLSDATLLDSKAKLNWLISTNLDLAFISEVKFHDKSKLSCVSNFLAGNNLGSYKFILNSTNASRGTGILISNRLNLHILSEHRDINENFLLLNCRLNNVNLVIGSIYAPNNAQSPFFTALENCMSSLQTKGHGRPP